MKKFKLTFGHRFQNFQALFEDPKTRRKLPYKVIEAQTRKGAMLQARKEWKAIKAVDIAPEGIYFKLEEMKA